MTKVVSVDFLKIFSLPLILYVIFISIRINGFQPEMEGELGDFITALNFLFGSFVSYFVFIFYIMTQKKLPMKKSLWWWMMSILLATLAFDELFMIHETVGSLLSFNETFVILFYGLLLGILLLLNLEETFTKDTFVFLVIFSFLTILSQGADYFYGEGLIVVMGRDISFEQFAESFGALSLSCAVITIAVRQLISKEAP